MISAIAVLTLSRPTSSDHPTPITQVLWMHPEAPTTIGSEQAYNVTLTVNESIPLADLVFLFYNGENAIYDPPTLSFTVINQSVPIAGYNLTQQHWTSGVSESLVSGDWFEIQITNQNLAADKLAAIGEGPFSSLCSIGFA